MSCVDPSASRKNAPNIKPATYDGTTSWLDYKSHFEACAKLGKWDETEKGLYLSVSLRGSAQGVLGNLSDGREMNYKELVSALSDRFAPPDQMDLYRTQLRERRQKASESLPELGQHIRRLVNLAFPTVPGDFKETLAKDHFKDALALSDMRLRIKQARPKNLNEAVRHAIELEAFLKAEQRLGAVTPSIRAMGQDYSPAVKVTSGLNYVNASIFDLQKSMEIIMKELKELKGKSENRFSNADWKKSAICHNCGNKGHIKKECRSKKNENSSRRAFSNEKQDRSQKVNSSNSTNKVGVVGDAGMFIEASICGLGIWV